MGWRFKYMKITYIKNILERKQNNILRYKQYHYKYQNQIYHLEQTDKCTVELDGRKKPQYSSVSSGNIILFFKRICFLIVFDISGLPFV